MFKDIFLSNCIWMFMLRQHIFSVKHDNCETMKKMIKALLRYLQGEMNFLETISYS